MDMETILNRKYQMDDYGRICNLRDLYSTFSPNVDLEALKNSAFFPALQEMMEVVLDTPDERSPEVMAYWAKRGMVKEFHGMDNVTDWDDYEKKYGYRWNAEKYGLKQNEHILWNSFVPVSAFRPENKDRKYPLVFALHGASNGQFLVEGWGFVQEAAKREWIVIIPSLQIDAFLMQILEEAKKLYPVDNDRIYVTGFSYGGWCSNRLGNLYPEVFAAVAPCGAPMDNGYMEGDSEDREPLPPFDGKPRALEKDLYMPILNVYGECDGNRFPVYRFKGKRFGLSTMVCPQDILDGINSWARVNHAKELTLESTMALETAENATLAEKQTGIAAPCQESYVADGVQYHMLGLPSEDGIVRTALLAEMNIPHWPTPEMARRIFQFFSHFSRDPETRKSVYHA